MAEAPSKRSGVAAISGIGMAQLIAWGSFMSALAVTFALVYGALADQH